MFSETHSDSQRADRILASIRREEARPGRGLLKIFFGMAPGVGKTCAMLEAAMSAGDVQRAFRAAHTLKGLAANLGLVQLGQAASALRNPNHETWNW